MRAIADMARTTGWRVAHFTRAKSARGRNITPVMFDGKGYPDLTMVRRDRLVIAELKSDSGAFKPGQREWLDAFRGVPGVEVYTWRPAQWWDGTIEAVLL